VAVATLPKRLTKKTDSPDHGTWIRGWKVHNTPLFSFFFSSFSSYFSFSLFFYFFFSLFHFSLFTYSPHPSSPPAADDLICSQAHPCRPPHELPRQRAPQPPPAASAVAASPSSLPHAAVKLPLPGPRRQPWRQLGRSSQGGHGGGPIEAS
jgi:hypothetical protein